MKLKRLILENFRGFKQFQCDFEPGVNVLVGINGIGKTSILDGISITYGQFFSALGTGIDRGIGDNEIHLCKFESQDLVNMEYQFPVVVASESYAIEDFPEIQGWSRQRNTLKGRTTQVRELKDIAHDLQASVQHGAAIDLPMFGYYGTARLWKQKSLSAKKAESLISSSRLEGYRDCMNPESSYSAFAKWLKDESQAENERRMAAFESVGFAHPSLLKGSPRGRLLSALAQAVNAVLAPSGWSNVRYSATQKDIVATHDTQGNIAVSNLSDGVRNMIGVVSDIAYRCIRLNPHLEQDAVQKTQGVVLIDEVDMHLHPQWQQSILASLASAFPNIQFIVTTHSPQVIGSFDQARIALIQKKGDNLFHGVTPAQAYGLSSNDILNELMLDPTSKLALLSRNEIVNAQLNQIFELIAQEEYETAKQAIETLQTRLGGDIPELVEAKLSIDLAGWDE